MENSNKYRDFNLIYKKEGEVMKKVLKVLCVISILILFMSLLYGEVYAFGVKDMDGSSSKVGEPIKEIDQRSQNIVKVISTIGSIVSVVTLISLGIKYMFGSVEEKATYKKTFLPYVIGATILFAASTIAGIIYNVAINL